MPFENRDYLEAWLTTQPQETSVLIAARAAIRLYPLSLCHSLKDAHQDWTLHDLRALIIARVASKELTKNIQSAANAAANAYTIGTAASAAAYTIGTAYAAANAYDTATAAAAAADGVVIGGIGGGVGGALISYRHAALSDDLIAHLENPFATDLWHGETPPQKLTEAWKQAKVQMGADTPWDFWRRWLEGFYGPTPKETIPFDVQKQIALLPNEDWKKGPNHIAELIKEIEAKYLGTHLIYAETIHLDETTQKLYAKPIPIENTHRLETELEVIEDYLDDALRGQGNALRAEGDIPFMVRRVLNKYRDNPQRIEVDFTQAAFLLGSDLEKGELPQNHNTDKLHRALEDTVRLIRSAYPEVAQSRLQKAREKLIALDETQKQVLQKALPVITAIARDDFAQEMSDDINALIAERPTGLNPDAPALQTDAALRVFTRAYKTKDLLSEVILKVKAHPSFVAAEILLVMSGIIGIVVSIIFGV